jgi:putative membrane-bound dehydrogenase-like protein
MMWRTASLTWLCLLSAGAEACAQQEFGFVNTRPSGQPYLTPEQSRLRMRVPPEFEVTVFAAEPDIINPISFTVDERGRLWVVECYEYPKRTPKGRKARDRIKVLEDTKGTGHADKVSVWVEGKDLPHFDLASGIEVGHGGVFLGAAPYLFFLQDKTGKGHCDSQEILLRGFGSQDTHEVLNTLQWGPDGLLYGLQGIFTQSKVGDIQMNAAVWRYDVMSRKFDIFAEGTSNPWGLDFDLHGQAFLTACVIPHAFHMIPGGAYIRQAGSSRNPYAYGLLREISDHKHHAESGWAHAGALVLEGDQIPKELQGSLLMGSIHGCSIKRDTLERRGSTFVAHHAPDFLVSGDKNFRPVNMRWAPDGSIYVIDWHDQNPCHQAQPDSWDMTHGRIYKIRRKGQPSVPPENLAKRSSAELVQLLRSHNPWTYRTALRLLAERWDQSVRDELETLANSKDEVSALRGLWAFWNTGIVSEAAAARLLDHARPWVRSWTIRLLGEGAPGIFLNQLVRMAARDPAVEVRLQLAATAQRLIPDHALPIVCNLMYHGEDANDPCLPLMIWLAYEPCVAADPSRQLAWLQEHASDNALIRDEILPRALHRLVATDRRNVLAACIDFLAQAGDPTVLRSAMSGLLQGLQNRQIAPPAGWRTVAAKLRQNHDALIRRLAVRLSVNFSDPDAFLAALTIAKDPANGLNERVDALRDLAIAHPAEARQTLEDLLAHADADVLRGEACRALAGYDDPQIAPAVLAHWKSFPPAVRVEAINLLAGRVGWAKALLAAVGRKDVLRSDLNNNVILRMRGLRNAELNRQIEAVWGKVRDSSPAELNRLIERMRGAVANGTGSIERGRKVFENQCAKCHRYEGRGHDVGPSLDGVSRDVDYLLVNILDPNRVVGQPYYTRLVALKNGRVESGLLAAEDDQSITLKTENDALKVIRRNDIEEMRTEEKSLMPEGLERNMNEQDFRDLLRYLTAK